MWICEVLKNVSGLKIMRKHHSENCSKLVFSARNTHIQQNNNNNKKKRKVDLRFWGVLEGLKTFYPIALQNLTVQTQNKHYTSPKN